MFGSIITSFISILLLVFAAQGFIFLYKKTMRAIFEKYPALSKGKTLVSGIMIFVFFMVFVLLFVLVQETFGITLL